MTSTTTTTSAARTILSLPTELLLRIVGALFPTANIPPPAYTPPTPYPIINGSRPVGSPDPRIALVLPNLPSIKALSQTSRLFHELCSPALDQALLTAAVRSHNKHTDPVLTVFQHAARDGNAPLINRLLAVGADPTFTIPREECLCVWDGGDHTFSPLVLAVRGGHEAAVRALVADRRVDINKCDEPDGLAAIHQAAAVGRDDMLSLLWQLGAKLDRETEAYECGGNCDGGRTPLFVATNAATASWLLAHGADITKRDSDGKTIPMWLLRGKHPGAGEYQTSNVAQVEYEARILAKPRKIGDEVAVEILRVLIEAGAGVDARDTDGKDLPLPSQVKEDKGEDEDEEEGDEEDGDEDEEDEEDGDGDEEDEEDGDEDGDEEGEDEEDEEDEEGSRFNYCADYRTALHWTAKEGLVRCAQLLLEKGAALNPVDCQGETPLDLAQRFKKPEVEAVLLAVGGVKGKTLGGLKAVGLLRATELEVSV